MASLKPSLWQRAAIDGVARRLNGRNSARAALLQLPTGFGKSLVAVRIYEKLRRSCPGLRMIVVLPKQEIPAGWRQALGFTDNDTVCLFERIRIRSTLGTVTFQTRLELKRAVIEPRRGRPSRLANEITETPHLVVIDEVHRHRKLIDALSHVFRETEQVGRTCAERRLSSAFRSPARGRRTWPKWLLLSATPINPVSLDRIDPLDRAAGEDTYDPESESFRDEDILATALESTHGALGQLAALQNGAWFEQHVENAKVRLSQAHTADPIEIPRKLAIWPRRVEALVIRPNASIRWRFDEEEYSETEVERAIAHVVLAAESIEHASGDHVRRRTTAERLVLSGGLLTTSNNLIQNEAYSPSLARSVAAAVAEFRRVGVARPAKLAALK